VTQKTYDVLFLCTGNSARSILAECLLNRLGAGRFRGYSAGSHPKGQVHPLAAELLRDAGEDTGGLCSKSWDEFAKKAAPPLDFVFTVCDDAEGETCPVWPGRPVTAHWGIEDPAAYAGPPDAQRAAFRRAYEQLETRIRLFASLPIESLDPESLKARLEEIGNRGRQHRGGV
jgi:arsenate reductase